MFLQLLLATADHDAAFGLPPQGAQLPALRLVPASTGAATATDGWQSALGEHAAFLKQCASRRSRTTSG